MTASLYFSTVKTNDINVILARMYSVFQPDTYGKGPRGVVCWDRHDVLVSCRLHLHPGCTRSRSRHIGNSEEVVRSMENMPCRSSYSLVGKSPAHNPTLNILVDHAV